MQISNFLQFIAYVISLSLIMASYKLYFTDLRPLERYFLGRNVPSNLKKAGELIGVDMVRALIRCSSIGRYVGH